MSEATQNHPPQGWARTTLGEIAAEPVEQGPPSAVGDFTYVDISSIDRDRKVIANPQRLPGASAPNRARQQLRSLDVIISMTRPNLNAVALVPPEFAGAVGSTGFCVLRGSHVSGDWLKYRVQAPDFVRAMTALVQGVLYPAVRPKDVFGFQLSLPPRREQDRIVAEIEKQFTRLDAAFGVLRRTQANLKRYRAALFKAACEGRLVQTEAELTCKDARSYETGEQLLDRVLVERRTKWEADQLSRMIAADKPPKDDSWKKRFKEPVSPETSTLPRLPAGWTWASLQQIAFIVGGITKGQKRAPEEILRSVPYLRVANVQRGYLDLNVIKTIEATNEEIRDLQLEVGDVLFNEGGDRDKLGRGWIWEGQVPVCIHQNHVFRARLASTDIVPAFVSHYANAHGQRYFIAEGKQTTNLASINLQKLSRFPIPIPPTAEQRRIVSELDRQLSDVTFAEKTCFGALLHADRLRQSILKSAFEGKLVSQDHNDEPASALLERIRAERASTLEEAEPARKRHRREPLAAEVTT